MTPQEALQHACNLFGPGTHIQVEITYGRRDLGEEHRAYWVFAGNDPSLHLCGHSDESWEEAIESVVSKQTAKEIALKGILGGIE